MKEKDTIILTGDEMVLTTATTIQKVWLPIGEYPKVIVKTGTRERRHVYGFLNLRTGTEIAWKTSYQTMYVTKDILKNIRALYPKKKIALFWDNAGWHKGSVVKEFLKQDDNFEIVWFPRYAPDENPQEKVWKAGRAAVTHNEYIEDIDKATDSLVRFSTKPNLNIPSSAKVGFHSARSIVALQLLSAFVEADTLKGFGFDPVRGYCSLTEQVWRTPCLPKGMARWALYCSMTVDLKFCSI